MRLLSDGQIVFARDPSQEDAAQRGVGDGQGIEMFDQPSFKANAGFGPFGRGLELGPGMNHPDEFRQFLPSELWRSCQRIIRQGKPHPCDTPGQAEQCRANGKPRDLAGDLSNLFVERQKLNTGHDVPCLYTRDERLFERTSATASGCCR